VRSILAAVLAILVIAIPAVAADCTAEATFSAPSVITRGGQYTANWESTDPTIPALQIHTTEPVSIVHSRFRGPGDLLVANLRGSNVTVRESCFTGTYPTRAGTGRGRAAAFRDPANIIVENNTFESTGGYQQGWTTFGTTVLVWGYGGNFTSENSVKI
jgi:hypothetical protein